ncbi:MAG: carbohydrate deacetylase [Pirellulaceae bacterium]
MMSADAHGRSERSKRHDDPERRPIILIVNADDYGADAEISAGIRDAHARGIVTSTSAMMNMPRVCEELDRARRDCPDLGLGVHLNFSEGEPLVAPADVPSLVTPAGKFRPPGRALFTADPRELALEFQAQVDRFVTTAGRPTHLDCHHHLACLIPRYFEVLAGLGRTWSVPVRLFADAESRERAAPGLGGFHEEVLRVHSRLPTARVDRVETRFYSDGPDRTPWFAIAGHLRDGITEWVCHPGLKGARPDGRGARLDRRREWQSLTDPVLRRALERQGARLASFAIFSNDLPSS